MFSDRISLASRVAAALMLATVLGCSSEPMPPIHMPPAGDSFLMTSHQVSALDSTGQAVVTSNPGNGTLKSLLDSTLQVFTAGITARRVAVTTDLTSSPLYFVGIHRVVQRATGSFSTWNVVGMDDPEALVNLIEISGFAQNATATAPTSLSGAIGTGAVNALFLNVANGGVVTQWSANSGTISFSSDAATVACPVPNPSANMTCAIETMHIHFNVSAASGSGGAAEDMVVFKDPVTTGQLAAPVTPPIRADLLKAARIAEAADMTRRTGWNAANECVPAHDGAEGITHGSTEG